METEATHEMAHSLGATDNEEHVRAPHVRGNKSVKWVFQTGDRSNCRLRILTRHPFQFLL
jgi:hypothetical protein